MPPKIALIAYIVLLIWLLRIERRHNPEASLSLWIPTLFFMIMASRPIRSWFAPGASGGSVAEGSLLDRLVLNVFILLALLVLCRRKIAWSQIFKENRCLILLYVFLGLSICWSEYPFNSFKRWFKIVGIVIMGFMVMSEHKPLQSLESLLRRCAYVLIPLSIVFIKYFPEYGVSYTWAGSRMGTGVTTHKNSLGVLCAVLVFFLIWRSFLKWRAGELFRTRSHTFADAMIIGIGLFLLFGGGDSYSATSILIFIIGMALLIVLYRYRNLTKNMANHLKPVLIAMVVLFLLTYSIFSPVVISLLDRNENLTERDEIWTSVIEIASQSPIIGSGYGGYWGLAGDTTKKHHGVDQSHNGYIEIYLQVGIIGIIVFILFIFEFCRNLQRVINHIYDWGVFGMCFLIMLLLYNYTEAGLITTSLMWSLTVFLTIVLSAYAFIQTESEQSFKEQ